MPQKFTLKYEEVGIKDVGEVGGKNASLGEMIRTLHAKGVPVPSGFTVTASAYFVFLKETGLDEFIAKTLKGLNTKNLKELQRCGKLVRDAITKTEFPADIAKAVREGYKQLERRYGKNTDVAVRSSATAEDLPGASFAGEQESYLGIRGENEVLKAVRATMASLFTDRAISYRADRGFDHLKIALSAGVQKMVRSDKACSGVMFTLDTESGFPNIVIVNGSWGLGEMIVKGEVTPDEFIVWKEGLKQNVKHPIIEKKLGVKLRKMIYHHGANIQQTKIVPTSEVERDTFVLSDHEVKKLAEWGAIVEQHYTEHYKKWTPMDMEWAKDGETGELFIVQARPETVNANKDFSKMKEYEKVFSSAKPITSGASVGSKIGVGKAHVILDTKHIGDFKKGEVLVTTMTDPDWEPIMKLASAIVTDKGGRTSHAAIVSRELGIPAVVGTERATKLIKTGEEITVDTTGSAGNIYRGALKFKVIEHDLKKIPKPKTKIMVNVAIPDNAFETSFLPNSGVGLAREEFIIASKMGLHPMALLNLKDQTPKVKKAIEEKMRGWSDPKKYYIDNLAFGIAKIGAAFFPNKVIVRFSDFKTNEYRTLLGGEMYEPKEENPMIGWRGASRYYDAKFKPAFMMEVAAIKMVREEMGLTNVIPMVPFCRTPEEGMKTQDAMGEAGLITHYFAKTHKIRHAAKSVANGKKLGITPIYAMCEIPSNVLSADAFLDIFDGMSIGSNDLTQLTLGLDRDSGIVSHVSNENNPAVKRLIAEIIEKCLARKKYIGICGQAPSDYPDFATFLVEKGIESISLNPDTVVKTTIAIAKKEKQLKR
jgi:pyruvate,water dikinase